MSDWEIKQLRHFKMIYELGSISSAAAHLGLTQSALTKSLKKLEERLDLQLFYRHTRELVATEAAQSLYHNVLEILASAEDFSRKVTQLSSGNLGQVHIACGPLIQQVLSETLVEKAIEKIPQINLQISGGNFKTLSYGLLNHEYDFMLYDSGDVQALNEPERFEVTPILKLPIVFVVSPKHPLYLKKDFNLFNYKWALPGVPLRYKTDMPEKFSRMFISAGIPHYQMESMGQCLNLAKKGLVVTAALESVAKKEVEDGHLVILKVPLKPVTSFALYRLRSRKLSEPASSVMALITSITQDDF